MSSLSILSCLWVGVNKLPINGGMSMVRTGKGLLLILVSVILQA